MDLHCPGFCTRRTKTGIRTQLSGLPICSREGRTRRGEFRLRLLIQAPSTFAGRRPTGSEVGSEAERFFRRTTMLRWNWQRIILCRCKIGVLRQDTAPETCGLEPLPECIG